MSKASSVVASVTQQSRQRVPHCRTYSYSTTPGAPNWALKLGNLFSSKTAMQSTVQSITDNSNIIM